MLSIQSVLQLLSPSTVDVVAVWIFGRKRNNERGGGAAGGGGGEGGGVRLKEDDMKEDEVAGIWVVVKVGVRDEDEIEVEIEIEVIFLKIEFFVKLIWPEKERSLSAIVIVWEEVKSAEIHIISEDTAWNLHDLSDASLRHAVWLKV